MKKLIVFVSLVSLFGCDQYKLNTELRHKYFIECLEKIPKGPERTEYNDWSEVVDSCSSIAYQLALQEIKEN